MKKSKYHKRGMLTLITVMYIVAYGIIFIMYGWQLTVALVLLIAGVNMYQTIEQ